MGNFMISTQFSGKSKCLPSAQYRPPQKNAITRAISYPIERDGRINGNYSWQKTAAATQEYQEIHFSNAGLTIAVISFDPRSSQPLNSHGTWLEMVPITASFPLQVFAWFHANLVLQGTRSEVRFPLHVVKVWTRVVQTRRQQQPAGTPPFTPYGVQMPISLLCQHSVYIDHRHQSFSILSLAEILCFNLV